MKNKKISKLTLSISIVIIIIFISVGLFLLFRNPLQKLSKLENISEKKPVFWLERTSHTEDKALHINIVGRRLFIADTSKLINFNIENPEAPKDRIIYSRPQGVKASYIHNQYLFEVMNNKHIRISRYRDPSRVVSIIDQFRVNSKLQFYKNYMFMASGRNIAVIHLGDDNIEIEKIHTFLDNIVDISISKNVLVVSLANNDLKLYNISNVTEPILITELKRESANHNYSLISSYENYVFLLVENELDKKYFVKQMDLTNISNIKWRNVLLSYEKITKLHFKGKYLGVVREDKYLDIFKIETVGSSNRLKSVLSTIGYDISDLDFYNDYIFISERSKNNYLKLYSLSY